MTVTDDLLNSFVVSNFSPLTTKQSLIGCCHNHFVVSKMRSLPGFDVKKHSNIVNKSWWVHVHVLLEFLVGVV